MNNAKQQYKIAELIAYMNGVCGNNDTQLQYARESMKYALETRKKNWIAMSYARICEAYQAKEKNDSALFYADKVISNISNADTADLPYLLNAAGFAYIEKDIAKAKVFLSNHSQISLWQELWKISRTSII